MFGDEKLAGMFKQKIDSDGELYFRGVIHFYGSKLPVSIELRPTNKAIKGERVYLAYSFLPAQRYEVKTLSQKHKQRQMLAGRIIAERKAKKILNAVGIIYEKQREQDERKRNRVQKNSRRNQKTL